MADMCASILLHLDEYLPLVMALSSVGKASMPVAGPGHVQLSPLVVMPYAASLGADHATWTRSQFVRMPDGTRDNGKRQIVHDLILNRSGRNGEEAATNPTPGQQPWPSRMSVASRLPLPGNHPAPAGTNTLRSAKKACAAGWIPIILPERRRWRRLQRRRRRRLQRGGGGGSIIDSSAIMVLAEISALLAPTAHPMARLLLPQSRNPPRWLWPV